MSKFNQLRSINVNDRVESKNGLSYLSWAWAWDTFKQHCPDATYEIVKNPNNGLPYFESQSGAIVYTKVTTEGETHEMWLPVMDNNNKAMKFEPYTYKTRSGDRTVEAFTMFDVNKTIMRCLVKNLAMFGLALYIFAGEDLPEEEPVDLGDIATSWVAQIDACTTMVELKSIFGAAYQALQKDKSSVERIAQAKDIKKAQLS